MKRLIFLSILLLISNFSIFADDPNIIKQKVIEIVGNEYIDDVFVSKLSENESLITIYFKIGYFNLYNYFNTIIENDLLNELKNEYLNLDIDILTIYQYRILINNNYNYNSEEIINIYNNMDIYLAGNVYVTENNIIKGYFVGNYTRYDQNKKLLLKYFLEFINIVNNYIKMGIIENIIY